MLLEPAAIGRLCYLMISRMRPAFSTLKAIALLAAGNAACQPAPAKAPDQVAMSGEAVAALAPAPLSPEEEAKQEAKQRAQSWLVLIDQQQYASSWDTAAPLFQTSTTKEQWEGALNEVRGALGELSRRKLRAAEYKEALSGAPEGKYVVVHYDSAFAKKDAAREIVTLMQVPEDSWKVVGYFVE